MHRRIAANRRRQASPLTRRGWSDIPVTPGFLSVEGVADRPPAEAQPAEPQPSGWLGAPPPDQSAPHAQH